MTQELEELRQGLVEFKRHAPHLWRVGANPVAENIVGREADHEQVRRRACAQLLVQNEFLGKFELVIVSERRGTDNPVQANPLPPFFLSASPCRRPPTASI